MVILHVRRNILSKNSCPLKGWFLFFSGLRAINSRSFVKKLLTELSYLHSTCPEECFEQTFFFENNIIVNSFSDFLSKSFWIERNSSAGFSNVSFTCAGKKLGRKNFLENTLIFLVFSDFHQNISDRDVKII